MLGWPYYLQVPYFMEVRHGLKSSTVGKLDKTVVKVGQPMSDVTLQLCGTDFKLRDKIELEMEIFYVEIMAMAI